MRYYHALSGREWRDHLEEWMDMNDDDMWVQLGGRNTSTSWQANDTERVAVKRNKDGEGRNCRCDADASGNLWQKDPPAPLCICRGGFRDTSRRRYTMICMSPVDRSIGGSECNHLPR